MTPATADAVRRPPVPVLGLQGGEREFLRGPLSRETSYRLLVSGDVGAKELAKIIKILTLQQEMLSESEAEGTDGPEQ